MPQNRAESGLGLIQLAVQAAQEGLSPHQIIRRVALYGYAEADLQGVIAEFDGRVDMLRRHFAEHDRIESGLA